MAAIYRSARIRTVTAPAALLTLGREVRTDKQEYIKGVILGTLLHFHFFYYYYYLAFAFFFVCRVSAVR